MLKARIPGYTYGEVSVARSPFSMDDLDHLKESVMFTDDDVRYLRMAGEVLKDQVDQILDVWYGFVASHSFLLQYFSRPDGTPDQHYMEAVRARFGQWIMDTCNRPYDQDWLDYQWEIALRHAPEKKNRTDNVHSTPYVGLRYMIALIYPITATVKPFLTAKGHSTDDVEKMHQAWSKSVTMQVALWSQPHIRQELPETPESRASM